MKKLILILAALLIFSFAGCGENKEQNKKPENITREEVEEPLISEEAQEQKEEPQEEGKTEGENKAEEKPEGKQQSETQKKETAASNTKSLAEIRSEIKTAVSASGAMDLDADAISSLYGISSSDMVQAVGFVVMEGTFPHEAVMVEAKDSAAADNAEKLLNAKYTSFVEQSKGYDAENYALAQKCRVERRGNHISMFLSPDFETMRTVYTKYIK